MTQEKGKSDVRYLRYVAIGDSQTEGLWDGDDSVGLTGFADRLAAVIDFHHPGLGYANLAVRGHRVCHVLDEQLPLALALRPDLITASAGMNDLIRPGRAFTRALADLEVLYARLAASGATVVTTTFPDIAKLLPGGRLLAPRIVRINATIRAAADIHGFRLVELYQAASTLELDAWSPDLLHASTKGHILFAAAAAEALGVPDSSHDWALPTGDTCRRPFAARPYARLRWTRNFLAPWIWSGLLRRSSGDGRAAKRPRLEGLIASCP